MPRALDQVLDSSRSHALSAYKTKVSDRQGRGNRLRGKTAYALLPVAFDWLSVDKVS